MKTTKKKNKKLASKEDKTFTVHVQYSHNVTGHKQITAASAEEAEEIAEGMEIDDFEDLSEDDGLEVLSVEEE